MRSTPTPRSASAADRSWSSSPPGSAGSNQAATPTWWCSDTWGRIRSPSGCAARVSTSSGWGPGAATDSWTCATPARRRIMADLALYSATYGDWRKLFTTLDDLDRVSPADVQRAANRYFVAVGRTTVYTVLPGQSDAPPPPKLPERKTGGPQ